MVLASNVALSTKKAGKYEEVIIQKLIPYFASKGYQVVPHSRLNIAWGSIISDVDLLLIKENMLTYVEVKSIKDKIARAPEQIDQAKDFVDYAYVATEKVVDKWTVPNVGLLLVQDGAIKLVKRAKRFRKKPRFLSILSLKKKCLATLLGLNAKYLNRIDKYDLAQNVYALKGKCNRKHLREIVVCGELCAQSCPITEMKK